MVTPMLRVPGSAAGAMRAMRPATGRATPSTCTSTGMPAAMRPTSWVPTLPASSRRARSTMLKSCCSGLTFSPGTAYRLATMPAMGACRLASRRPTRVVSSAACAALSWARAVSSAERELSSAMVDMNCCAARRSLLACARSACSSVARADSSCAPRSATRLARSASSMRPISCPARTRLPSATSSSSSVPPALARTIAVCGATSAPENSTTPGRRASVGCTTSRAANSSATSGLPSPGLPSPGLPLPGAEADWAITAPTAAPPGTFSKPVVHARPAPATTARPRPPVHHHLLRMFLSPRLGRQAPSCQCGAV